MKREWKAIALDFDNTIANTFAPSHSGIGVNEACRMAVARMFGTHGVRAFDVIGGLQNRAPLELIQALFSQDGCRHDFLTAAKQYLELYLTELDGLVRHGSGVPLVWVDNDPEPVVAELFVRVKLRTLLREISRNPQGLWPIPCAGIVPYLKRIKAHDIPLAILSSGHEAFIRKAFALWRQECPSTMVTDDDLRGLAGVPREKRTKPSEFVFQRLLDVWKANDPRITGIQRCDIAYVGDDPIRDGKLAHSAGARFVWFNPYGEKLPDGGAKPDIEIQHFTQLFPQRRP